jgi:hypothetical protein
MSALTHLRTLLALLSLSIATLSALSSASSSSPVHQSINVSSSTGEAHKEEEKGFFQRGVGISLVILLIFAIIIGLGAFLQIRKERRATAERRREAEVGRAATMRTSLLGGEGGEHFGNSRL